MAKPVMQLKSLGKSFGDRILYENLDLSLGEGEKAALIARNGAGKTTLLNIIAGKEGVDSGEVVFRSGIRIGYLGQEPVFDSDATVSDVLYRTGTELTKTVKAYEAAYESGNHAELQELLPRMDALSAWDYESRVKAILTRLRVNDITRKTDSLSGGERKRVALAAALIENPDLLILDEPTNHLDLDMVEWLEDYLSRSNRTLLLVTHDRYFLDRICTVIYELDEGGIYRYDGNYSYYLEKREERIARMDAETERARNLYRRELEWMSRMPQARGTKAKYRKDAFYETKEIALRKRDEAAVGIKAGAVRMGNKIFEMRDLSKKFGEKVLMKDFSYTFSRYDKVGIIGKNGTGKSTFLNLLTGTVEPDSGTVEVGASIHFGYYRQDGLNFDETKTVIDAAREVADEVTLPDGNTVSVAQFLTRFLFPHSTHHQLIRKLSGGEKRRLYLMTVLMRNPNFLILDEPTNDLDIMTLNVLEEYLADFSGCVLIVSHDRYFMDRIAEHILVFEGNGVISDFPGNYTQYRNKKEQEVAEAKDVLREEAKPEVERTVLKNRPKKRSYKEQKEFENLEYEIRDLETEKAALELELGSGTLTAEELTAKSVRIGEVIGWIDEKTLRWMELSEIEE